jgi:hypothetical protein
MNPRIDFRITETAFVSDFFIVSFLAGLGSVLCPPSDDSNYTSERGENGLPHCYFLEKRLKNETTLVNVASGSSPGIREAIAITAERRATNAPSQAKMSCD